MGVNCEKVRRDGGGSKEGEGRMQCECVCAPAKACVEVLVLNGA